MNYCFPSSSSTHWNSHVLVRCHCLRSPFAKKGLSLESNSKNRQKKATTLRQISITLRVLTLTRVAPTDTHYPVGNLHNQTLYLYMRRDVLYPYTAERRDVLGCTSQEAVYGNSLISRELLILWCVFHLKDG